MKYRALLSATAIISASFSSISFTSAANAASYASSANPPSVADMQAVCDTLDSDGAGTDYQVVMTPGTVVQGAPTFDTSTITDDENTRVADHSTTSSPYGTRAFYSAPGRHGGSVNLFATVGYPGITYAGSFVDQNADRTETDTYNFSCQLQDKEVVGSQDVVVPAQGQYVFDTVNGHGNGSDCDAHNANHPSWWGIDLYHDNCVFDGTLQTTTTEPVYGFVNTGAPVAESLTDGPYFYDNTVYATHVSEPTVPATETNNAPYFAGDVVVCNNPGKKGGTWTAQNGWTDMTKCTTTYFNTAPYISGANVFSSNSLPL
jgi:hypothetical protein